MKWQLLHKACFAGDAAEAARLLEAGANPNQVAPTNWRQTPLGRTLEFRITCPKHEGHVEVVRSLLRHGADPAVRSTQYDMTPYELACICGLEPAATILRDAQRAARPHPDGLSEVWIAAASRLPEDQCLAWLRELLLSAAVKYAWRGATPLMMATGHALHFRVADLLLEHGADPNEGVSILHSSCEWHFEHLVRALRYLAGHGWRVNAKDEKSGRSALHNAAFLGYSAAARTLLELGADASARDREGFTPLDLARRWRKPAVIKLLMAKS